MTLTFLETLQDLSTVGNLILPRFRLHIIDSHNVMNLLIKWTVGTIFSIESHSHPISFVKGDLIHCICIFVNSQGNGRSVRMEQWPQEDWRRRNGLTWNYGWRSTARNGSKSAQTISKRILNFIQSITQLEQWGNLKLIMKCIYFIYKSGEHSINI